MNKYSWLVGLLAIVGIIIYGRYQNDPKLFEQVTEVLIGDDSTVVVKPKKKPSKKKRPSPKKSGPKKSQSKSNSKYPDIAKLILRGMHIRANMVVESKGYGMMDMGESFHNVYNVSKTDSAVIEFIDVWITQQIELGIKVIEYNHLKDSIYINE